MAQVTHCNPSGATITSTQIVPSNVSVGTCTMYLPSGGAGLGNIRGVVVYMHGLPVSAAAIPSTIGADGATPSFLGYYNTFKTVVNLDGWAVLAVSYPEDFWAVGSTALFNDITNDGGNGSRYVATTLLWWDHVVQYIHLNYGAWPIVPFGQSWGGYHSMLIAANSPSSILGYMAHVPATQWQNSSPTFTGPTHLYNLPGNVAQLSSTVMNSTTLPGIIGYGTADEAAGYDGVTTVAAGFVTAAASAVTALTLTSTTGFYNGSGGPLASVVTTGGSGLAIYSYTSISAGALQGCTLLSGSGNVVAGAAVTQSLTKTIIANQQAAQPSNKVTSNVTPDTHEFTSADAGQYTTFTPAGPTALSGLSTLNVGSTTGSSSTTGSAGALTSTACAIYASDNLWHTITFSGSTSTTLTGCSYSGSSSATVSAGSPVCQTNYAVGGSFPYWMAQTLNPLAPRTF